MLLRLSAGMKRSQGRRSSTAGPCVPRPRAEPAPVTTAPSARKRSKLHLAVDTLGHMLALHVTPASVGDRDAVGQMARDIQAATDESVEIAFVDQGYTGERAAAAAAGPGIELSVVKLPQAKRGFVLLPRRWVVERTFAWASRFRRLARYYERCASKDFYPPRVDSVIGRCVPFPAKP